MIDPPEAPFLEQNLSLLRSRYPGLAEVVFDNGHNGAWSIKRSALGDPTLSYNGVYIHSSRDPAKEGKRQAEAALETAEKSGGSGGGLIFLLGFCLGYTAEALALKEDTTLVIVEKRKELFRLALEERNLETLLGPGRAVFVIGGESGSVTGALALLEKAGRQQQPLVIKNRALTSLTAEDENWYAEAEGRIKTWASKDEINAATLRRFGRRWTKNLGANLSGVYRFPGVHNFEDILKDTGIPVFLAAAGPSLTLADTALKAIYRRAVTVAVDTSLRFLVKRGIEPDFVVSVDPQYWNALHLHRLRSPATALVAESAVYPSVLHMNEGTFGRVLFCQSLFPLGRFIEDRTDPKGPLGAGGSVATTAWDFARLLGPEDIWIAGLDLAFPGYHTHFKGALFEENGHAVSSRYCPVETLSVRALESGIPFSAPAAGGAKVLTDRRLSLYAAWFENRFSQTAINNYSLTASEVASADKPAAGLAIPGLEPAQLEKLLAQRECRDEINRLFGGVYKNMDAAFYEKTAAQNRENRYSKALKSLISGLEELETAAEDAGSAARRGLKHPPAGAEQEKLLKKFDTVNRIIAESSVKEAAGFLFPSAEKLEAEAELAETEPDSNFSGSRLSSKEEAWRRYLAFSVSFYHSLLEAVHFTLETLKKKT
ncbi:hypothetical protein AGMMS50230_17830 [Spirochaetia bacterium]|nr:hypothetical protein AGMMS50230_17830 [Spirochaetia bacterium]